MRDRLSEALRNSTADQVEVRYEVRDATRITYRGKELEEASLTSDNGGCARALVNGGWGFASFNDVGAVEDSVARAVGFAGHSGGEALSLPPREPCDASVASLPARSVETVSLEEKKLLLDEYRDIIMSSPRIQSCHILYSDSLRTVRYASSDGCYIEQRVPDLALRVAAIARDGSEVQQAGVSLGSVGDFSAIEKLHDQVRDVARRAAALLDATNVKGGEYTVVLDPVLAGVFTHEAFGHLSEADLVYDSPQMRELMTIGRRFGGRHLNIVDDATISSLRGGYAYDDEGTPGQRTHLIREGVLVGRLHSRETAARMGEAPSGNARAIDYRFSPIVRMSNTYIEPGDVQLSDMLADIQEGVYVKDWYGGQTSLEMFTFSAGESYMIRNGKVAEMLRPVVLTGNVFTTLERIDAIGGDLDMNQGGGCGKSGQSPLPVSNGSPHVRISRCVVGGR
ncbi:MAG: TldD/PmbA family protein [Dehalococcoidia bacterium]|jgi:TldD protein|nr:TldD/PmbA family protein [Dehalococcoidia bacterium]